MVGSTLLCSSPRDSETSRATRTPSDGYFSRFNKPVTVNEADFALTDTLYEIAPIVGGPNGQTLSSSYSKALNSLIPTFESIEVRQQRR